MLQNSGSRIKYVKQHNNLIGSKKAKGYLLSEPKLERNSSLHE